MNTSGMSIDSALSSETHLLPNRDGEELQLQRLSPKLHQRLEDLVITWPARTKRLRVNAGEGERHAAVASVGWVAAPGGGSGGAAR